MVRFTITGRELNTPFSTKYMERRGVNDNWFVNFVATMMQSHENISLDADFNFHLTTIATP